MKAELQKLLKALRKRGALVGKAFVITARVPIIKCTLAGSGNQHIPADISLGVANGLSAVAFIEQQVTHMPPHHSLTALQQTLMFAAVMATACLTNRESRVGDLDQASGAQVTSKRVRPTMHGHGAAGDAAGALSEGAGHGAQGPAAAAGPERARGRGPGLLLPAQPHHRSPHGSGMP